MLQSPFKGYITCDRRKPVFRWWQYGENAARFLEQMSSHLRIKHEQAQLAIRYQEGLSDGRGRGALSFSEQRQRAALASQIRALNNQRVSPASHTGSLTESRTSIAIPAQNPPLKFL